MEAQPVMQRLFRLTKREYFADFFITPPLTASLAALSLHDGITPRWAALLVAGLLSWTLYEYVLHRWVLHHVWPLAVMHDLHHDTPSEYIGLHPLATLGAYVTFWLLFGASGSALSVGFSTGYITYSCLHTAFHYIPAGPREWWFPLKRRHAIHHTFKVYNFGVTTSLWDRVFGTEF